MPRHTIELDFSLEQIVNNNVVNIDIKNWTDRSAEGLAHFLHTAAPNWQTLIVTKNRIVHDTQKQDGGNIVNQKKSILKIARQNSMEVQSVKVDKNLAKNGKIPANIRDFFNVR